MCGLTLSSATLILFCHQVSVSKDIKAEQYGLITCNQ
uniref:Uncharacterized protein n=1 Tax=Lepeophtheirus salmonis TaxID=72036 RepID=A0A0K2SY00_LEPSM